MQEIALHITLKSKYYFRFIFLNLQITHIRNGSYSNLTLVQRRQAQATQCLVWGVFCYSEVCRLSFIYLRKLEVINISKKVTIYWIENKYVLKKNSS